MLEEVLSRVVTFNRLLKSRTGMEYELQKELDNTSACQSDSVSKVHYPLRSFFQTYFIQNSRHLVLLGEHFATQIRR